MLGQGRLLDMQLPLEELHTSSASNNASVKSHLGWGQAESEDISVREDRD